MAHDVFLPYSSADKTTADGVCALLEGENIRCWTAPRDIAPGADWGEAIIDGISGARVFVLIFSDSANNSVQVKREVERAVHKEIPIIPFRIEDVGPSKSLEYYLSTPHWLDAFTPPLEKHTRYLAQTIQRILDGDMALSNPEPARAIPLPPVSSRAPQKWQKKWQIAAAMVGQPGMVESELSISADGSYVLRVVQSESGQHEAGGGQWTRTPNTTPNTNGVPKQGNYVFNGNDMMTATSDSVSVTWRRVE